MQELAPFSILLLLSFYIELITEEISLLANILTCYSEAISLLCALQQLDFFEFLLPLKKIVPSYINYCRISRSRLLISYRLETTGVEFCQSSSHTILLHCLSITNQTQFTSVAIPKFPEQNKGFIKSKQLSLVYNQSESVNVDCGEIKREILS